VNEAFFHSVSTGTNFFTNIWNSNFGARLVNNDISYHLWYIYSVIGLYLFIPILNKWIKNSSIKEIIYFLSIWLISLIISYSYFRNKISLELKPIYFSGYIGYLVLGYFLFKVNIREVVGKRLSKFDNKIFYATLILLSSLVTIFGTYFISIKKGYFSEVFYNRLSVNVMVAAIGVFLFMKSWKPTRKIFINAINFLFKYCYGIFLVHVFVLFYLSLLGINGYFIHPIIGIPVTTFACFGISLLLVFLVNKLPFIGKYISG
jgi:surface polysaccharide O-acyltransferase-like enzyme